MLGDVLLITEKHKKAAKQITKITLNNSEGCKLKNPKESQRVEPWICSPKIATIPNKTMPAINNIGAKPLKIL